MFGAILLVLRAWFLEMSSRSHSGTCPVFASCGMQRSDLCGIVLQRVGSSLSPGFAFRAAFTSWVYEWLISWCRLVQTVVCCCVLCVVVCCCVLCVVCCVLRLLLPVQDFHFPFHFPLSTFHSLTLPFPLVFCFRLRLGLRLRSLFHLFPPLSLSLSLYSLSRSVPSPCRSLERCV